jgi:hypothetical protein
MSQNQYDNKKMDEDDMGVILRDFTYKLECAKKIDENTRNSLQDSVMINFILSDEPVPKFNFETYFNQKTDDQYDESYDDDSILLYDTFIKNNMSVDNLSLVYENEVVLKCSYINVFFGHPNFAEQTTFRIVASDILKGFTMKELALKVMQKYHMLVFLYKNYDMEKGTIVTEMLPFNDRCFRPCMYEGEWTDNGVSGLQYHKDVDYWEVILFNYI